jgi:hypothetical protein
MQKSQFLEAILAVPQELFAASIASKAAEVLENHLLFPGSYLLSLSARGTGVPSVTDLL